jgi:hypothetical protein
MQALYVIHPKYNITMQVQKTRGKRKTRDRHVVTKNRVKCSCLLSCLSNVWVCLESLRLLCDVANHLCATSSKQMQLQPSLAAHRDNSETKTRCTLLSTTHQPLIATVIAHLHRHRIACATPHSGDDGNILLARLAQRNHVGEPVHHNNHAHFTSTSNKPLAPSPEDAHSAHRGKDTTTADSKHRHHQQTQTKNPRKMCITYISLYTSCGCTSDSLFEPCDQAMYGHCNLPTQKNFAYDDDDPNMRICAECLTALQESVRRLFLRFQSDGVKVASRAGDQVFFGRW